MRLVFAGTPQVALPSLRALLDSPHHDVVAVITRPARPAGRGRHEAPTPVAALAEEAGIPVLAPDRAGDPGFLAALADLRPDCCPVVAYGALLPRAALDIPVHGWVNLHFSLLPAWRGAAPVQHAVLAGDEITGASTFLIEEGLDTGPVFGVLTETVRPTDTAGDLLDRLAAGGAHLLAATMDGIADGSLVAVPQPADGVSIAGKITVAAAEVDWQASAQRIDRLVRACSPAPGAWTTLRGERLKLGPVSPDQAGWPGESPRSGLAPGELQPLKHEVSVGTGSTPVKLSTVQPPGKRPMPAADWARGLRLQPGERLG